MAFFQHWTRNTKSFAICNMRISMLFIITLFMVFSFVLVMFYFFFFSFCTLVLLLLLWLLLVGFSLVGELLCGTHSLLLFTQMQIFHVLSCKKWHFATHCIRRSLFFLGSKHGAGFNYLLEASSDQNR